MRWLGVALALLCACPAAACADSGSSTSTAADSAKSAPRILQRATLSVLAPTVANGAFVDDVSNAATAPTCAASARGFSRDGIRYTPPHPTPTALESGGTHVLVLTLHAGAYTGPASYTSPAVAGDDGPVMATFDGVAYGTANGGSATIVVKQDGSGSLTLDKLTVAPPVPASSDQPVPAPTPLPPGSPTLSLTMSWRCEQVVAPPPSPEPSGGSPGAPAPSRAP